LNGWDAVVCSLGTGLSPFREVSLPTVATRALVTAMTRNGVRRLVSISALGVGGQPSRRLRVRPAVPAFAAQPCLHMESQEAAIRASSLDLVIVRPAMLTNDLVGASGPSPTSPASMAARLHASMSLGSWWSSN